MLRSLNYIINKICKIKDLPGYIASSGPIFSSKTALAGVYPGVIVTGAKTEPEPAATLQDEWK
jgi:hypothetical protein